MENTVHVHKRQCDWDGPCPSGTFLTPALTTTFAPPLGCLAETFTLIPGGSDSVDYGTSELIPASLNTTVIGAEFNAFRGMYKRCWPGYDTTVSSMNGTTLGSALNVAASYSPGGICPLGYYTASQATTANGTSATCCPSYVPCEKRLLLTRS